MNSGYKTKAELIAWRRNKVIELKAQGRSQEEIAQILQVSPATVTLDLQYLIQEAKQNIRFHTIERLPLQIRVSIAGAESIAKELWNISQNAKDDEIKIKALVGLSNVYKHLLHLMAESAPYVTSTFNQLASELTPEQLQAMKEQERKAWAMQLK